MVTTRAKAKSTMAKKKQSPRHSQVKRKRKARKPKTEHKEEKIPDHETSNEPEKLYPGEVFRLSNDETAPLEEQVKYVKDRFEILAAYVAQLTEEEDVVRAAMYDWYNTVPGFWPKDFGVIESLISGFSFHWACMDFDEHTLSKKEKEQLIASLDGYCVQEDFDAIVSRLPPHIRKIVLSKFAMTFLIKLAVETFFEHPFWYIEFPPGEEEEEEVTWQGVLPDGAVLERYWAQFEKDNAVNPKYSRYWRCLATRLCNAMNDSQGDDDHAFGEAIKARRHARCRSLASKTLANETFRCLLKPTEKVSRREQSLATCLIKISDIAVAVHSQNPMLRFHTLRDLEPRFHRTSERMNACFEHWRDDHEDPRVDGHRVLFLTFPFVFRVFNDTEEDDEVLVFKAVAVMEGNRSPEEEESEKPLKKQKRKVKKK